MGTLVEGCACNNCNKDQIKQDETDTESESDENNNLNYLSRREIPKNIVDVHLKYIKN